VTWRLRLHDQTTLPGLFRRTRNVNALHQRELNQQRAPEGNVNFAGAGGKLSRLVIGEKKKKVLRDQHAVDPRPKSARMPCASTPGDQTSSRHLTRALGRRRVRMSLPHF
jgi:hypothetical protein